MALHMRKCMHVVYINIITPVLGPTHDEFHSISRHQSKMTIVYTCKTYGCPEGSYASFLSLQILPQSNDLLQAPGNKARSKLMKEYHNNGYDIKN